MDPILKQIITKILNISEAELESLIMEGEGDKKALKSNAADLLLAQYTEKIIEPNKKAITEKGNEIHAKALVDADRKVRDLLKNIGFEIESEKKIFESAEDLKSYFNSKIKTNLTDDQVKAHPLFIALEDSKLKADKEWKDKLNTEKETWTKEQQKKETLSKVKEIAENYILETKAVIPSDPAKRKNFLNTFLNAHLSGLEYEVVGNDIFIMDPQPDGTRKRRESSLGHAVNFKEFVNGIVNDNLEIAVQGGKGSPVSGGGQGGQGGSSYSFTDAADFDKQYASEPDRQKRVEMASAWEAQQK